MTIILINNLGLRYNYIAASLQCKGFFVFAGLCTYSVYSATGTCLELPLRHHARPSKQKKEKRKSSLF